MTRQKLSYKCDAPDSAFSPMNGQDFCSRCQTSVIDMRELPDDEIRKIVAAHDGNLCVKIHSDQLSRVKGTQPSIRRKIAVAGTAALLAIATESSAQTSDSTRTEQVQTIPGSSVPVPFPATADSVSAPTGQEGMTLDDPSVKPRPFKKRVYLRLRHREFYVMNRTPFFGSRRRSGWMGKF